MQELSSGDTKYELSRARKKKAQQRTKLHWWPPAHRSEKNPIKSLKLAYLCITSVEPF